MVGGRVQKGALWVSAPDTPVLRLCGASKRTASKAVVARSANAPANPARRVLRVRGDSGKFDLERVLAYVEQALPPAARDVFREHAEDGEEEKKRVNQAESGFVRSIRESWIFADVNKDGM